MTLRFELIRPDDLLDLQIEGINLKLDATASEEPTLLVDDPQQAAYLVVTFPPQTISEMAHFESSGLKPNPPASPDPPGDPDASRPTDPLDPPGIAGGHCNVAQLAHPSRLVFKVPADAHISYSIAGLLDWSRLSLNVSPLAAIPPNPSQDQIAVAPPITPPLPIETALEVPYRLWISPNSDVVWTHRRTPFTMGGQTELWHTIAADPAAPDNPVPLRAIWSPDYDMIDQPPTEPDCDPGLTAMSSQDRHQIVVLTSAFHGYEVNVDLGLFHGIPVRFTEPFLPTPFEADQLMLSGLGTWLHSRGQWDPPREIQDGDLGSQWPGLGGILGVLQSDLPRPTDRSLRAATAADIHPSDPRLLARVDEQQSAFPGLFTSREPEQLSLSEWVHIAAQGRDHYVRIVYEGELLPFHHRAALIKVTERKFEEANGIVGAYLMQHMFIVVREPEKTFTEADRAMPLKNVRLTTVVTPDIAPPKYIPSTQSFCVEVFTGSSSERAPFTFHAEGTDLSGQRIDFTIPLVFMSISEDAKSRPLVYGAYDDPSNLAVRTARVPGQKLVFAERDAAPGKSNDNTQLVTDALNFIVDGQTGATRLLKADVRIPQVQELLGTDRPTSIRLTDSYISNGFAASPATGIFAEIVKDDGVTPDVLPVEFSSDKAGGFATPDLQVSSLSRALGPMSGNVQDAIVDHFDPSSFFGGGIAQLFGSLDLADLLPPGTLGGNAPKMSTASEPISGGKQITTTLDWEPDIHNVSVPATTGDIVTFTKNQPPGNQSRLTIHGVIKKSATPGGVAEPPTFQFTGKLDHFQITILKSISVNFTEFNFTTQANTKPIVGVTLDPADPIAFSGDLQFVEELRKAIPPDLFGKGPSLDISPTGIRAGFAIALPPVAVGIFALKDVSLGAALTLPFLDGKPVFDFNVSERPHPFLLAVGIFGGGGFFHLQLDTAGIKELEASFEFGATAAIDIGVASGGVHMMAGIYFSMQRRDSDNKLLATLSGYLRVGGSLSVLGLITVSVEFNLSFTYDSNKQAAYGRATLTVQVEIAFFSKSVELTVERSFGGSGGDPKFVEMFTTPETWAEYAGAFG
jgi:hypothetical protein